MSQPIKFIETKSYPVKSRTAYCCPSIYCKKKDTILEQKIEYDVNLSETDHYKIQLGFDTAYRNVALAQLAAVPDTKWFGAFIDSETLESPIYIMPSTLQIFHERKFSGVIFDVFNYNSSFKFDQKISITFIHVLKQ